MRTLDELRALYEAMPLDRLRDAVAEGEASYRPEAWQIIQEEIRRRRDDGRLQSENELEPADTPARISPTDEERLTGVRGWLAVFVVVVALGLVASTFQGFDLIASGEATVTALLLLLWIPVLSYGLHLIFGRDARAPRYWIIVMIAQAILGGAVATIDGEVGNSARSVVGSLVWAMYWANSRRVRHTFAASPALALPVGPSAGDLALEANTPSAPLPPAAEPSVEAIAGRDATASFHLAEGQRERVELRPVPTSYDVDTRRRDEPRAVAVGHAMRSVSRRWVAVGVISVVLLALFVVGTRHIRSSGNGGGAQPDGGVPPSVSAAQTLTPRDIAERARDATVQIRALDAGGAVIGQGTGFFLSKHGLIGTNLHVIRRAHALQVETLSGDTYDLVFYVTADARRDVAILKIPVDDGRPLPLALDTAIAVGERVYVMGNPLGQTGTFSDGLVSANRAVNGVSLLQMTAPVSPGSSGGPVLNARGEVVGMATLMLREGQNLNYAVPVRYIRPLLETGEPPRRYAVGLLPRAAGLSSIGVTGGGGAGSSRRSRDPAAPRLDDAVGTQFVAADSSMRSVGGELASPIRRGSLENGGSKSHEVVLTRGQQYAIVGYCDEGCSDLDLALSRPAGTLLASDVLPDDKPNLLFTAPVSGTYRLRVTLASCSIAPCAYGVRLYRF